MSQEQLPLFIASFREELPVHLSKLADDIWKEKELYIRWPRRCLLFMPGTIRQKKHIYEAEHKLQLKSAKIGVNALSNGPAMMAYLLAGGERPWRSNNKHQWSIHHIYDGNFPASPETPCSRAVVHGNYFTQAAGLVAVHPVAHALADELAYFAWLLRYEAYVRFGFDPDKVFD